MHARTHQDVDGGQLERAARAGHGPDLAEALYTGPVRGLLGDQEVLGLEEERVHARLAHARLDERAVGGGAPVVVCWGQKPDESNPTRG